MAILMGSAVLFIIGYSFGSQAPAPNVIDGATAKAYFQNYYRSAQPVNEAIRGFSIGMDQYEAMGQIAQQLPGIQGFRVYFGKDGEGNRLGLVVGVDGRGTENNTLIMSSYGGMLESCPFACDEASAISGR